MRKLCPSSFFSKRGQAQYGSVKANGLMDYALATGACHPCDMELLYRGHAPVLGIRLVGEAPASQMYVKRKFGAVGDQT